MKYIIYTLYAGIELRGVNSNVVIKTVLFFGEERFGVHLESVYLGPCVFHAPSLKPDRELKKTKGMNQGKATQHTIKPVGSKWIGKAT